MDFEEMNKAYVVAKNSPMPAQRITRYDHIVVCKPDGNYSVCRSDSGTSMFWYEEIGIFFTRDDARRVADALNEKESAK